MLEGWLPHPERHSSRVRHDRLENTPEVAEWESVTFLDHLVPKFIDTPKGPHALFSGELLSDLEQDFAREGIERHDWLWADGKDGSGKLVRGGRTRVGEEWWIRGVFEDPRVGHSRCDRELGRDGKTNGEFSDVSKS